MLLALLLAQVGPQNTGAVTGIVRGANGMPAPGVRVYAMTVRDAAEAAIAGNALDSIAQTDASGRYRLEVAPGRYYIASGSVGSPTYYPGTIELSAARVISIAAGGVVESIDFSSFVPASRTPTGPGVSITPLPSGSTGVLGGTLRFQDGAPAPQMAVVAIPAAALGGTGGAAPSTVVGVFSVMSSVSVGLGGQNRVVRRIVNGFNIPQAVTDVNGRYRLENVPPDTYYVATGFADAPLFLPGTSEILAAKTFVTTPTTLMDTLDFVVPRQLGVSISGRVTALGGAPAAGVTVQVRSATPTISNFASFGLPGRNLNVSTTATADGTFEVLRVMPGTYLLDARALGISTPTTRSVTVTDQPVGGIELSVPISILSGKILLEDGSALANPQLFKEAIVTTALNPNMLVSTVVPIAADGTFSRFIETNQYRFYLGYLPDEYIIKSVTSGTRDLLKETLEVTPTETANIDVRVAARTGPSGTNDVKVSGKVLDSITGLPALAERVTLCCLDSALWKRFSTPLRSDGSFEFAGVPRGHRYDLGLQTGASQPRLFPVDSRVEVADSPVSGLSFLSTPQLVEVAATIVLENGSPLPLAVPATVVFTGALGRVRVIAQRNIDASYYAALVPAGDRYNVSVTDLPEGYSVKTISGSPDIPPAPQATPSTPARVPLPPAPIQIMVAPSVPQPQR